MSILDKLKAFPRSGELQKRVIQIDESGFSVSTEKNEDTRVEWSSVNEIVAFKNDLYGIDEICLGFRCYDDDKYLWVGEEDIGFTEIQAKTEEVFDGIHEGWWNTVAFPAFEDNWTSIWKRDAIQ